MSDSDLFSHINNAVLDLQQAELSTYERPLKTLVRLLNDVTLSAINQDLTAGVDLDAFLEQSSESGKGLGGATLVWPEDSKECLGLTLMLLSKLAESSQFTLNFSHTYFRSGTKTVAGIHSMVRQLIIPFVRDFRTHAQRVMNDARGKSRSRPQPVPGSNHKVFVVHGHDEAARETAARFLERIGLQPIILHEQANRGRTVIEKVEAFGDVGFAVVLLTPDDVGRASRDSDLEPRARQNVLLELGYVLGRLGRENVCTLKRGHVEIPSDFAGVVWQDMDAAGGWKVALGKELKDAGYQFDWNQVMG